jgi:hypothetical protein
LESEGEDEDEEDEEDLNENDEHDNFEDLAHKYDVGFEGMVIINVVSCII